MAALTLSIFSAFYLQFIKHIHTVNLFWKNHVKVYFRYNDDRLIVYNEFLGDIISMLHEFNNISLKLEFTQELENNDKINFLDITLMKNHNSIETSIHRKLTTTDCIIPSDSCHSIEHKQAGIRYLILRNKNDFIHKDEKKK